MKREDVTLQYVSECIKSLYLYKPYFGYTLSRLKRVIDSKNSAEESPLGLICVSAPKMTLFINADFFARTADIAFHKMMLEHEIAHIGMLHFYRFKLIYEDVTTTDTERHIVNIACDVAVDQMNHCLADKNGFTFPTLENTSKAFKVALEPKQHAEYYYKMLMESDKAKQNMQNEQDFRDALNQAVKGYGDALKQTKQAHDQGFKDAKTHEMPAKLKEALRHACKLQEKKDKTNGVGKGESILDLLPQETSQYDREIWKKLIDKNIGDEIVADINYMFGRPSRRNADSFHWRKHQTRAKVVYFGFDTSASVDDRAIARFLGYASKGLRANSCQATLILCDYEIQDVRKVHSIKMGAEFKVQGRGGTDLRHILDYIEKNEKDPKTARLILFTDGETPWRYSVVKTSVVYTPNHSKLEEGIISSAVMEATLAD